MTHIRCVFESTMNFDFEKKNCSGAQDSEEREGGGQGQGVVPHPVPKHIPFHIPSLLAEMGVPSSQKGDTNPEREEEKDLL